MKRRVGWAVARLFNIFGRRGSGKTSELIRRAAEENAVILCANREQVGSITYRARELGLKIKTPKTYDDLMSGRLKGTEQRIMVDEVDAFIWEVINYKLGSVYVGGTHTLNESGVVNVDMHEKEGLTFVERLQEFLDKYSK